MLGAATGPYCCSIRPADETESVHAVVLKPPGALKAGAKTLLAAVSGLCAAAQRFDARKYELWVHSVMTPSTPTTSSDCLNCVNSSVTVSTY